MATIEQQDKMSKEERTAYDAKERAREQTEQDALPYKWSQDLNTVSVSVPLPNGTRGRDLQVIMERRKLKVDVKGGATLLEGELFEEIAKDDSSWTIEDGTLTFELEKMSAHIGSHRWWPHVLTHDPKIDTTKIQPESSKLSDLDGETRAMVEKMMVPRLQRQAGKPTSDEIKKMETLEKFKKAHPEMDFSNAKMG
ncbi:hypothetical protein CspHIS471_0511910 [Cutaneotrichosporon sp. HIS471]|nr:hypothetical protein CspHIS471_0511910 [Cutaneotrichosporon sp. HIS471]